LIIVGAILLAVMILFVGKFRLEPENSYRTCFKFTRGLVKDAPVRLAGVEVGKVDALNLIEDPREGYTKVEVVFSISRHIRLREGTVANISSLGLMGEKYIEINPGPPGGNFIPTDGTGVIASVDPIQMETLLKVGEDIVKKLQEIITTVNEAVATEEMKDSIKNSFKNIAKATEDISKIASDVRYGVDREKFKETMDNFYRVSAALDQGIKGENLQKVTENLEIISQNLKEFSEDIKQHPWKLFKRESPPPHSSSRDKLSPNK
jgi:phospholipid/cholesterol/gamma-HCH transport system substrate-binding protein